MLGKLKEIIANSISSIGGKICVEQKYIVLKT
jgi:hypothetical protein